MKKITLLFTICAFLMANVINAQTVVWSSDLEDLTGWSSYDADGDGQNWAFYTGGEDVGMTGKFTGSASWSSTLGALTPDNYLYTPVVAIPAEAVVITYKMKVVSPHATFFAEKFAVYAFDSDLETPDFIPIHLETLTAGGAGTAKDVSIVVPDSFAGKNVRFLVRHYDCTDMVAIYMDDFEVSYTTGAQTVNTVTIDWSFNSTPSATGNSNASRTIEIGDTVTWNWYAGGTHNVKSNASATETFESGYFESGGTFSYTFTSEGSNDYVCSPHPSTMFGTITVVAEGALSTSEARRLNFEMFPNPASDKVSIQLPSGAENATVEFYDSLGRLALSKKVTRINNKMDVNALSKGIYILKVFTADQIGSQKFIKN